MTVSKFWKEPNERGQTYDNETMKQNLIKDCSHDL